MGIPFVPTLGYANSDVISERDDFTIAPNPFNPSEPMVMAKAITPDVALFHGSKADKRGNVLVKKGGEALMLAQASDRVIVTVEEVVDQVSPDDPSGDLHPGHSCEGRGPRSLSGPSQRLFRPSTPWTLTR